MLRNFTEQDTFHAMNKTQKKTLEQVVDEYGRYPLEAFEFVRHGLNFTVQRIHGEARSKSETACHVSGQQLAWGLRNYAVMRYGVLASTVLNHWGINRTNDFGKIVFTMVEFKLMQKTDEDDLRDFDSVFDFDTAFAPPERPVREPTKMFEL
jgi:uncharacterized repeat protein (TIGR04138 family)